MNRLRELRIRRQADSDAEEWTQLKVAERLRVTEQTYGGWERGQYTPRPHHLLRLAELFGVSVEELGFEGRP